ncbi:Glycoside hydrolase family 16 - like 4 [Theobroma cacao]|nr:Glycoside hydrolase family 16 - like 4 [Theobroma cacao]
MFQGKNGLSKPIFSGMRVLQEVEKRGINSGSTRQKVRRVDAMGGDYPSKPMSLYAIIWDGSTWATGEGKHKINYRYAPFKADFTFFVIQGHECSTEGQIQRCKNATASSVESFNGLRPDERSKMKDFRKNFMIYSHCQDRRRYPIALPECSIQ